MTAKRHTPPSSANVNYDESPPFLPLEETMRSRSGTEVSLEDTAGEEFHDQQSSMSSNKGKGTSSHLAGISGMLRIPHINIKKIILAFIVLMFTTIIWESFFVEPDNRLVQPDFSDRFLTWVQSNPGWGLGAILVVIAAAVVSMVPIGTPLTLGCGFIYRGVYGWKLGLFVSTLVSMAGSTLGAVICFLLGRYLMRDTVRRWVRNYPLFDAIDVAASEHGLKIMAMLYLTPILPLGLVSYMCGTTAMDLSSFALAKIASLPLYLIYTFIGASAHSFIKRGSTGASNDVKDGDGGVHSLSGETQKIEENQYLIVSGLVLSLVMMTLITRNIRKELMKILDEQKKEKTAGTPLLSSESNFAKGDDNDEKNIEMGLTSRRKIPTKTGGGK